MSGLKRLPVPGAPTTWFSPQRLARAPGSETGIFQTGEFGCGPNQVFEFSSEESLPALVPLASLACVRVRSYCHGCELDPTMAGHNFHYLTLASV